MKPQEVADLWTQKEVLAHALFLGCTVSQYTPCPYYYSTKIKSKGFSLKFAWVYV